MYTFVSLYIFHDTFFTTICTTTASKYSCFVSKYVTLVRVGCVAYNVHKQVMPESCHYLTALHAHVIPVLSPCFLYHPYMPHF